MMTVETVLGRLPASIAFLLALLGCAAADGQSTIIRDIAYYYGADADDDRHRLNLVLPQGVRNAPLLMWIPGGAWAAGDREMPIAVQLAKAGIAVAVIDHRMSAGRYLSERLPDTGVTHPAHITDAARAFRWIKDHAEEYGYDANNLFIGGFSSGAHLAALLVMDPQYLNAAGASREDVRAAVPVSGAYDLERYYEAIVRELGSEFADAHILGTFGSIEMARAASPNAYLAGATAPMLVLSDSETFDYTRWFEDEVAQAGLGDLIAFLHVRDETHASLFRILGSVEGDYPPRDAIADFIKRTAAR